MQILRTSLASLALLLAGGAGFSVATDGFQAFTTESARRIAVLRHPVAVPAVALQTQSGAHVDFADLRGRWLLVDFIYTGCPSFCAALGGEFAQLQDRLSDPISRGMVGLLSVSFDPDRDTPGRLADFMRRSGDRGRGWLSARPIAPGGLRELERAFALTVIADGLGGYTHNAAVHLVDPGGRLVEIFDLGDPERVAQAVQRRLAR